MRTATDELCARLECALALEGAAHSDNTLNPDLGPVQGPLTPAAVLIPVVDRADGAHLLLTQRTDHLPTHQGQVAFPGGKIDPGDGGPMEAALREAQEEIGLGPDRVRVLGMLPPYETRSGFSVHGVIGIVRPGFQLTLNEGEVADAFEVPLPFLLDRANHTKVSGEWNGKKRYFYAMTYEKRFIWGVTAGIIRMLADRMAEGEP